MKFSKDPSDIGNIPDFQMDINLTESLPVHESYCLIPRKLYDEVKNHIKDFLTNQWIRKSPSAYASPMVYARKKMVVYVFAEITKNSITKPSLTNSQSPKFRIF